MEHHAASGILVRIGRKISAMRKRSLMTQADLARKLRIRTEDVARIEKGLYKMRLRMLFRIAHVFGRRIEVKLVKRRGGI